MNALARQPARRQTTLYILLGVCRRCQHHQQTYHDYETGHNGSSFFRPQVEEERPVGGRLCNGCGLPAVHRAGVGLRSMRERAEELGGTLAVSPRLWGGTVVRAELPFTQFPGDPYQQDEKSDG